MDRHRTPSSQYDRVLPRSGIAGGSQDEDDRTKVGQSHGLANYKTLQTLEKHLPGIASTQACTPGNN
jgi:hypothetical protein